MRIFIIGGTAFIGYNVVKLLLRDDGNELMLLNRGNRQPEWSDQVGLLKGDKKDIYNFRPQIESFRPDVVLDMMAISDTDAGLVTRACRGITSRIIMISSCDVYRAYDILIGNVKDKPEPMPLTEKSALRGEYYPYRNHDQVSEKLKHYDKILSEKVYLEDPDFNSTVIRLPMVYGPRDYQHRLFPYVKRMVDDRPAILIDKGQASMRITRGFVENMAGFITAAILKGSDSKQIFNAGDEQSFTEMEWIQTIAGSYGWKGEVVVSPQDEGSEGNAGIQQDLLIDSTLIRQQLGFGEQISLEDGLERTIEWEINNPPKDFNPDQFNYQEEDRLLSQWSN